jgi:hypothetical protein
MLLNKIGAAVLAVSIVAAPSFSMVKEINIELPKEEVYPWERDIKLEPIMQFHTWNLCEEYGADYDLILSIMKLESNYESEAYNTANSNGTTDYGYMQINSGNTEWVDQLAGRDVDLSNPLDNIEAGILIYQFYESYWKNHGVEGDNLIQYTLNSYNMGLGGYKRVGLVSRSYDRNITDFKENLEAPDLTQN